MEYQETSTTSDQYAQELEAFFHDGGTLAMLRDVSSDTLEQLYSLAFNQYQSGKWQDAHKIFQALCMLDHYDHRFFLGLGACRQAMGQLEQAIQSYSYGAMLDVNEPRFPFHAAECLMRLGELDGAESGFYSAKQLAAALPEQAALVASASAMLEAITIKRAQEDESNSK